MNKEKVGKIITISNPNPNSNRFEHSKKVERDLTADDLERIDRCDSNIWRLINLLLLSYNVKKSCLIYLEENNRESKDGIIHFAEVNRMLLTVLSSFYSYVQFCEKNFNQDYKDLSHKFYDDNFEYRLFTNLRRLMVHSGIGITQRTQQFGEEKINCFYSVDPIIMADSLKVKSSFKKELKELIANGLKAININESIDQFVTIIDEYTLAILNKCNGSLIKDFEWLVSITPNYNSKMILCLFEENGSEVKKSHFKTMTVFLESFSRCFIYLMDKEKSEKIIKNQYSLFRRVCTIYYQNEDAIPSDK